MIKMTAKFRNQQTGEEWPVVIGQDYRTSKEAALDFRRLCNKYTNFFISPIGFELEHS